MWSDITPCALVNGTGILVYSLCTACASTIVIRDRKYSSKFCDKCDKKTFTMKYPNHARKHPFTFYDVLLNDDGKVMDDGESTWKQMVPCSVTGRGAIVTVVLSSCCRPTVTTSDGELMFNFCVDCQKRTSLAKFPKPFKSTEASETKK